MTISKKPRKLKIISGGSIFVGVIINVFVSLFTFIFLLKVMPENQDMYFWLILTCLSLLSLYGIWSFIAGFSLKTEEEIKAEKLDNLLSQKKLQDEGIKEADYYLDRNPNYHEPDDYEIENSKDKVWREDSNWKDNKIADNSFVVIVALLIGGLIFGAIGGGLCFKLYGKESLVVPIIFTIVGSFMLLVSIFRYLKFRKFGTFFCVLNPFPGRIGKPLNIRIEMPKKTTQTNHSVQIKITCKNYFRSSGKNGTSHETLYFAAEKPALVNKNIQGGITMSANFTIPEKLRSSGNIPNVPNGTSTMNWEVEVVEKDNKEKSGLRFHKKFYIPVFHEVNAK